MDYSVRIRSAGEKAMFDLRALYEKFGYVPYRAGRFVEYDLYAENRSFLTGGGILTFTDTDGRLMALKPDVTLSIVESTKKHPRSLIKVYYSENVYRAPDPSAGFREIPQTGLECIGPLDLYSVCEVLELASMSLAAISAEHILDVSHVGLLSGFLADSGVPDGLRPQILKLAGEKNAHEAEGLCRENGVSSAVVDKLRTLIMLRAPLGAALDRITSLEPGPEEMAAVEELRDISGVLAGRGLADGIFLDLSLQCDLSYYTGVVFRGFVDGVPSGILSGGRYDGLMRRMGRDSGAIGFAVYLDMLERRGGFERPFDADVLLLVGDGADVAAAMAEAQRLMDGGETVRVDRTVPEDLKYRRLVRFGK